MLILLSYVVLTRTGMSQGSTFTHIKGQLALFLLSWFKKKDLFTPALHKAPDPLACPFLFIMWRAEAVISHPVTTLRAGPGDLTMLHPPAAPQSLSSFCLNPVSQITKPKWLHLLGDAAVTSMNSSACAW